MRENTKKSWKNRLPQQAQLCMFSDQSSKNQSSDKDLFPILTPTVSPKALKKKVKKTQHKVQTQAVHNLGKLLCLKTIQMDQYRYILDYKSNIYLQHQMVQSFLWI